MAMKWFLNVRIARSEGLARWLLGGTYCTVTGCAWERKSAVRSVERSLSAIKSMMGKPRERKNSKVLENE